MGAKFTLDQIAKMSPAIQAQIYGKPVPATSRSVESPQEPKQPPSQPVSFPVDAPSALDRSPVYIPAQVIRHILENWGSAFYVCANETQRRRVVDHAVKSLAASETKPFPT